MSALPQHRQPERRSRLVRYVAGGVVGVGLALSGVGFGMGTAHADLIDQLAAEYSTGAGAGQIVNLINTSLTLRAQGFKPKPADYAAIQAAMDKRPNQMPLIDALTAAVAHQQKAMVQAGGGGGQGGQPPVNLGVNTLPWNPQNGNPMIQVTPIFPMPGRS